jgi:hypothetical protein
LRKAQNGNTIIGTPSLKDVGVKNIYQGPLNESDYKNLNTLYPINNESPRLESTVMAPRAVQKDKTVMGPKVRMSQSSGNEYMRNRVANYLRSGKTLDNDGENIYAPTEKELYSVEGKKRGGATKSIMKKGGAVKKYAKGGSKFPDKNGDGKITKADILIARGVIKKKGGTVKAQFGKTIRAKAATRKVNKDKGYFTYSNDDKQSTVYNAYSKEGKTNALKKREIENRLKAKGMPIMKGSYIPNNPSETEYSKVVKKSGGAVKAKFGASVSVQRSPKAGKVRSASAQGYSAVGKREPGRIIKKTISKKK